MTMAGVPRRRRSGGAERAALSAVSPDLRPLAAMIAVCKVAYVVRCAGVPRFLLPRKKYCAAKTMASATIASTATSTRSFTGRVPVLDATGLPAHHNAQIAVRGPMSALGSAS
jgi:hypothetical protein